MPLLHDPAYGSLSLDAVGTDGKTADETRELSDVSGDDTASFANDVDVANDDDVAKGKEAADATQCFETALEQHVAVEEATGALLLHNDVIRAFMASADEVPRGRV